ncbi:MULTISPECIES: CGNR zinc finger domain-containing protein [unclassified Agromyces]|uniref:CGNR zinc finger domain-containing protein n=1 Tax=unclassified Agromyces TaxID=2639701 RepID=UPI0006F369DD|nr:CGNR zinc finger domain-containing protein [Agromyces sp. Leaf222]KQM83911.1 RNA-binding protein [Agromyces sp. Leaf222]
MFFTHDTESALAFVSALTDTVPASSDSGDDELRTVAQLSELIAVWRYSGRHDRDARELAEVRDAREQLRRLWLLDRDAAAEAVNDLLAEARALPRLVRHDDLDWHIHATALDEPLATRILVEAAMAFVDVIRADQMDRLRVCDADDCESLYVDLSKNGSRRFCTTRCGNRMAVRAYRARADAV